MILEHILLGLSVALNIYLHYKRPHRHIKVVPHPTAKGVWVRTLKTRKP